MEERSENSVIPHSLSRQTNNLYDRWFQSMKKIRQHLNLPRTPPAKDLALKRKNKLISILSNKCLDSMKLRSALYCVLGIIISIVSTSLYTCWPQQFPLGNSTKWYETMLLFSFNYGFLSALDITNVSIFLIGAPKKSWPLPFLQVFFVGSVSTFLVISIIYIFWIIVGREVYPMPFQGYVGGVFGWQMMILTHSKIYIG